MEASMAINSEKGKTRDPGLEAAIQDAEELRDQLQVGAERFFRYRLYITLYADSLDELNFVQHKIETIFGQQLVFSKVASSQQGRVWTLLCRKCSTNYRSGATWILVQFQPTSHSPVPTLPTTGNPVRHQHAQ